jgi:hypothetical protein
MLAKVSDQQIDEGAHLGWYMLTMRIDRVDGVLVPEKFLQDRDKAARFDRFGDQKHRAHDQALPVDCRETRRVGAVAL